MDVGHDLGLVDARVDRVLPGAQRLLPDAAVAGAHDRAELELGARRVERRQADERLDDRDLALVHHEHRHHVDADEERVQQVRAVEQRVVLQTDLAAGVEERLEVLVVVVQVVLAAEQQLDAVGVVTVAVPSASAASSAAMSSKPPSRLAMSPDGSGSPSSVVTTPTMSMSPSGAITTTRSMSGESPNDSGVSVPESDCCDEVGRHRQAVDRLRA